MRKNKLLERDTETMKESDRKGNETARKGERDSERQRERKRESERQRQRKRERPAIISRAAQESFPHLPPPTFLT